MTQEPTPQQPEISIAPMMDWTDRHCRYFLRLITPHAKLYTEMVTTGALIHRNKNRFLRFDDSEHPVALQLGGSNPKDLALCAEWGEECGYDEINLNCGCPSDRVQSGRFGACLMREPDHVAACVSAMIAAVNVPVTVKCRTGIDEHDDYAFLDKFVGKVADSGCKTFIIHARKAWLSGLSPKENREVPPLLYERVEEVKNNYPELRIIVNGGIKTLEETQKHLQAFDGVMIGREAYQNPYIFAEFERKVFANHDILGREKIARRMAHYAEAQFDQFGTPVKSITRHMMGLYHHQPGAKQWRRGLSTYPYQEGANHNAILMALEDLKKAQRKAA
jgi:tRNA-dihydrouridine synthase A